MQKGEIQHQVSQIELTKIKARLSFRRISSNDFCTLKRTTNLCFLKFAVFAVFLQDYQKGRDIFLLIEDVQTATSAFSSSRSIRKLIGLFIECEILQDS